MATMMLSKAIVRGPAMSLRQGALPYPENRRGGVNFQQLS